jgi:bla regulator protein blaR1
MIVAAHLWQSTVCLLLAALLARALKRGPADVRYTIWLLASAKFLMPFSLLAAAGSAAARGAGPLFNIQPAGAPAWLSRPLAVWNLDLPAATTPVPAFDRVWLLALISAWLVGAIVLTAWRCQKWREFVTIARCSSRLDRGREVNALARIARSSRALAIEVRQCHGRLEPTILGVRKPLLLWPGELSSRLSDEELDAIIAHEACHAVRRDNLTALVQMAVETMFWFYPPVWWIGARLTVEREIACDEEVVRLGRDKESYAAAILEVCRFCLQAPLALGSNVGGGDLKTRITQIMESMPAPLPSHAARIVLAAAAALIVAVPFSAGAVGMGRAATGTATQEDAKVHKPGDGVTLPVVIREVKPQYTPEARQAKIQGAVELDVVVLATGEVGETKVSKSLDTQYGLDEAAVAAMKQWRFKPGTKDGKPVPVRVQVEMTFTLK